MKQQTKLAKILAEKRLSQTWLSLATKIHKSQVNRYYKGHNKLEDSEIRTVRKISEALGVPMEDLLNDA